MATCYPSRTLLESARQAVVRSRSTGSRTLQLISHPGPPHLATLSTTPSRSHRYDTCADYRQSVRCASNRVSQGTYSSSRSLASAFENVDRGSLYFPRRAVMYVPASDERKVKKTTSLRVDSLVFDIEDGVAVSQKEKARNSIGPALETCRHGDSASACSEHVVRVNGIRSGLLHLDLSAVFRSCGLHRVSPDAIMLPKADSVDHIAELDLSLSYYRGPSHSPLPLYIIMESPAGLQNLSAICHFATQRTSHVRLCAVVFGSDDFLAALGGVRTKDAAEVVYARQAVVTEARAVGVEAIDMVDTNFRDLDSLKMHAEAAAKMGFTGKQVIHPSQVELVQEAFSPTQEAVGWASRLIQAFQYHQQSGKGAFVYEGQMIDRPLLLQAQNIVNLQNVVKNNNS